MCTEATILYLEKSWRKLSPIECDMQHMLDYCSKLFCSSLSCYRMLKYTLFFTFHSALGFSFP